MALNNKWQKKVFFYPLPLLFAWYHAPEGGFIIWEALQHITDCPTAVAPLRPTTCTSSPVPSAATRSRTRGSITGLPGSRGGNHQDLLLVAPANCVP